MRNGSKGAIGVGFVAGLWLLAAGPAAAEVLYSQAPDFSSGFSPSHDDGWRTYDEFHLDQDSAITRIDWWGLGRTGVLSDEGLSPTLNFTIEIYTSLFEDFGDVVLPYVDFDQPLASFTADVPWERSGPMNRPVPVQHYWYEFDTPLALPGNQVLWLGIHTNGADPRFGWYWLRGAATGEADPVYNWINPSQDLFYIINPDPLGGNFAFSLSGESRSAAPEPGAWLLMLAGAGLAGAALRRRRAFA